MKNTMRNTLLVTVAATALIAGAGLASAQGTGENREAPGAATQQPKAPGGKMDQQPNGAAAEVAGAECAGAHEAGTDRTGARKGDPGANRAGTDEGEAG